MSGRARILVIDDDAAIRGVLKRILASIYDVVLLEDAKLALAQIESGERFDLVLCDLQLPELSGTELHALLAERAPEQASRLVFLSGQRVDPGPEGPSVPVLEKPFSPADLRARVAALLEAMSGGASPAGG